jgi:glycosyltransferase involved in cell wall biosynthesis
MSGASPAPLRVLHCPWNIGGHPGLLALHEREIGTGSHCITLRDSPYGFPADEVLLTPAMQAKDEDRVRLQLFARAIRDFDVIHFNFGQTILESTTIPKLDRCANWKGKLRKLYQFVTWMADLPLLRICNKAIVMTYQGDDARQSDYCREHFEVNAADETDYYTVESDQWKRRAIRRVARFADRIYALNPDLLHVLPPGSRFLAYANVDPQQWVASPPTRNTVPRVVHAPTHQGVKGTRYILDAVEQLHREGVAFEFVLVEGMSRSEARREYESADLLVDQILLGWYGGVAVELMALGKPVVCYIRQEDLKFVPEAMRRDLPLIDASPKTIKAVLGDLLTRRRGELPELGRRSRLFVEEWHDPRKIARQIVTDYHGLMARRSFRNRLSPLLRWSSGT